MYGTLRPGEVNYDLVAPDVIEQVPAQLVGHCLKAAAHAGVPYAAAALGAEIVGDLLRMRPGTERQVLVGRP